jgi:hypothetical protein
MTAFIGTFRIGEDFTVGLKAAGEGDPEDFTATAFLHRSVSQYVFQRDPDFTPVELSVAPRAATESVPAGWNIAVTAAQSAELVAGTYGIDAAIEDASGLIDITDITGLITLTVSAVPPPEATP